VLDPNLNLEIQTQNRNQWAVHIVLGITKFMIVNGTTYVMPSNLNLDEKTRGNQIDNKRGELRQCLRVLSKFEIQIQNKKL
jgi:hypothetical protein